MKTHSNKSNGGILGKPSSSSGYREPAILTDETYGENKYYNSINNRVTQEPCTSVEEVANQYITDYNNMVNSVEKYKGFYIGRYEITANGEKPGTSLSGNWYSLYNKCITLANDNAESSMIYGTLWDATMMWLAKSDYSVGYTQNLTGKLGNYVREEISVRNEDCTIIVKESGKLARFITGQVSYTMMNNIYDLIGNLSTFTQEALGSDKRVSRGGDYGVAFAHATYASYRYGDIRTTGNGAVSTRPQLYIKVD